MIPCNCGSADLALIPPAAEQLERITAPALIITAEYDLDACRAVAHQMDAEIPDSTTVDLAGATHFMGATGRIDSMLICDGGSTSGSTD